MKSVYIIVLNYNHYEDTIKCIDSLKQLQYDNMHIVIVDNHSVNDSVKKIKAVLPDYGVLLATEKNLGYAGGNNVGIRYAIENDAEFICILNNDTVVKKDFLEKCINILSDPMVGFVGPVQINMDDYIIQSNGGNIDFKFGTTSKIDRGKELSEVNEDNSCDFIVGACIMCRASLIKEIGMIPEVYFLNYEETEWCYRAKRLGYEVISTTTTYIRHKISASINDVKGLNNYLLNRNRIVFFKRNSPSKKVYYSIIKQIILDTMYGIIHGKKDCIVALLQYIDGILGRVNRKKFPFIIVNEDENI